MDRIRLYIDKISNGTFHSHDVPLVLKALRQDAKSGLIGLTKDDVQMFKIYTFALQQLELLSGDAPFSVHAGDWRETVDDLSLLRQIIDEMEHMDVISDVSWSAGGLAIYDIPDRRHYRDYIHSMIRNHLARLYERYV